jgi:SMI1-KNR4 cell-wall
VSTLLHLVDNALDSWIAEGANFIPGVVPEDMAGGQSRDDWHSWIPINSRVTAAQLSELATELGVPLPRQYQEILKHRHFLDLYIGSVGFVSHPSIGWQDSIKRAVLGGWPRELLLDKGFAPFADYSDWGLWCFSIRETSLEGEHPIYLWDHDRPQSHEYVAATLEEALHKEAQSART